MISAIGTSSGVSEAALPAQFSTRALLSLSAALRRFDASQATAAANRERTALALGLEPGEVSQPLSFEFTAVSAASH